MAHHTKIKQLEAMHAKCMALLAVADQQAAHIRDTTQIAHDDVNTKIAALERTIQASYPDVSPAVARQYGALLALRKQYANVITNRSPRTWDQGHTGQL